MNRRRNYIIEVSENHQMSKSHLCLWRISMPSFKFEKVYLNFCSNGQVVPKETFYIVLFINIVDIKSFNRESTFTRRSIFFDEQPEIQIDFEVSKRISGY